MPAAGPVFRIGAAGDAAAVLDQRLNPAADQRGNQPSQRHAQQQRDEQRRDHGFDGQLHARIAQPGGLGRENYPVQTFGDDAEEHLGAPQEIDPPERRLAAQDGREYR